AVRAVGQLANKKSIEIVETPDSTLCTVQGDYGRLRQMLVIILDNAIKFTPENGKVAVTLKDRSISIKDNGPGIAQEDLPYIFDRFYKVKSVENKNGTGLGLSIAKQIAERHNIEVSVISIKDSGTEFDFHF
ncbi:MAG: sensor histidine kinase, partial [Clostridiales bacterium]|nr:sensor histidine kinase [Clostridiales bacterium]